MCQECAKKVREILNQMEEAGEFRGLSKDQKEVERQSLGLRFRGDMKCPQEKQPRREPKIIEISKYDVARLKTDKGSFKCLIVGEQLYVRGEGSETPIYKLSVESADNGFMISKRPIKPK